MILICPSENADFEMAMYNADGSRSEMCGNGIRCVAKYVYDYGLTDKTSISVETLGGIKYLDLTVEDGKVSLVRVDMGKPELRANQIPIICESEDEECVVDEDSVVGGGYVEEKGTNSDKKQVINESIVVDGMEYRITGVSMGNPHAVVFLRI